MFRETYLALFNPFLNLKVINSIYFLYLKKHIKIMKYLAITLLLLFTTVACTVEEKNPNEVDNEVTTENVSLTMVENPENGDIIGMVEGNSNNGTLSYTIISQTPEGSMEINTSTGELTVADKTEFEYQINPVISAIVKVSNGTNFETSIVTVDLEERSNILIGDVVLTSQEDVDNFGLERYTEITGYMIIGGLGTDIITNLEPLLGLNYIGNYLGITFNDQLNNLDGLESLIHVKTFVEVISNSNLENINGLRNLEKVGDPSFLSSGSISIWFNPELQNLDGLINLKEVSAYIHVSDNLTLEDIDGLGNLESIEHLLIVNNDNITHLNGLRHTLSIANEIMITQNDRLIDFCGLETAFTDNDYTGTYEVEMNGYNPTQNQIINGECRL